jgi:hypothetical protein
VSQTTGLIRTVLTAGTILEPKHVGFPALLTYEDFLQADMRVALEKSELDDVVGDFNH